MAERTELVTADEAFARAVLAHPVHAVAVRVLQRGLSGAISGKRPDDTRRFPCMLLGDPIIQGRVRP